MLIGRGIALLVFSTSVSTLATAQTATSSGGDAAVQFETDGHKPELKAEGVAEGKADASPSVAAKPSNEVRAATQGGSGLRRDPKGKKGISPYFEAIRRGDQAALARDFAKAEAAYQDAIGVDPTNPVGHFRKGQILARAGKWNDAETAYQDALRLAEKDATARGAALFVLADLKERKGDRDAAIAAWKSYADHLKNDATAKGYPETPVERDKRLKRYGELVVEGKAVRERIQLRIKELDDANKRKAAKNPNEGK